MTATGASETYVFDVRGMTCATCARRVERALSKVEGVEACEVDLVRERARVTARSGVAEAPLLRSVEAIGYQLEPVRAGEPPVARSGPRPETVRAGIALALAALAMAAAMIPGAPGRPWLEIALAAACTFGAGWPILRKAAREARALDASMDTLVAIGALSALAVSIASALEHGAHGHTYAESAAMIVAFVLLGRALEERAKEAASGAIRALTALRPATARVVRHGAEAIVPASELRAGDEVRVGANERVPADGSLSEGEAWLDESWLTGESAPVRRRAGDRLIAGSLAAGTALRMRVEAAGGQTELARVERLVERAQASRAPIVRLADRVSAVFVPSMIAIAVLTTLGWWLVLGASFEQAIVAGVTVIVVACPCALGLATPTAITVAIGRAAQNGILVRDAASIEALARARAVVLDKTGTLTEGRPELVEAVAIEGDGALERALRLAAAVELESEHPIGRAIVDAAMARGVAVPDARAVVATTGRGVRGEVEGARVEIRAIDRTVEQALPAAARDAIAAARARAATVVLAEIDGAPAAIFAVRDVLRPGAAEAIAALRALDLEIALMSGDHPTSAAAVGRELGLAEGEVRAGMRPEEKLRELERLRARLSARSATVAMVGDGVNDAPALAAADVGMAIGSGAAAALETAGVVLSRPEPRRIASAVALARRTMRVVRQNLGWAFLYNAVMVPFAVAGGFGAIGGPALAAAAMAGSSLTVVLNSLRLRAVRVDPR